MKSFFMHEVIFWLNSHLLLKQIASSGFSIFVSIRKEFEKQNAKTRRSRYMYPEVNKYFADDIVFPSHVLIFIESTICNVKLRIDPR